ncbi:MAG: hypothetical protein J6A63_05850 [Clostridia bacterium]|nr:hypothetical protein [Clostridia bacterium]
MKALKQIVFTKPYTAEYLTVNERDFSKIGEREVIIKTALRSERLSRGIYPFCHG